MQGQNFNAPGIIYGLRALFTQRSLLNPSLHVKELRSINFDRFKADGFRAVCIDKDNTLSSPFSPSIHPSLESTWMLMKETFPGKVLIHSNSAGGPNDTDYQEAKKLEEIFGAPIMRHKKKKPEGGHLISETLGESSSKIIFIGDRLMTDVLMANLHGMFSVLVDPLEPSKDLWTVRMIRPIERYLVCPSRNRTSYESSPYLLPRP